MRLSIIIVSYNVYPFLDNCLLSIRQALKGIEGEVIVVDNASVDNTPDLVRAHFPEIKLIENHINAGFAKANNQGILASRGEYILLLNPDTIVSDNTFCLCLDFMDVHPEAGGAGVRMLDGSGRFLPESKRGLPTLKSSFMKMTGLYKLFPASKSLNSYYQGHIRENEISRIEVLSGAFMFLRKEALNKAGLLDEAFFMYGEDIDLSYRILKSGYSIYYLPTTSIIHYKGESTKKSSLNYLLTFYEAMLIFIRKHPEFNGQQFLIKIAIYTHGTYRLIRQMISNLWPPVLDAIMAGTSYLIVAKGWATFYHDNPDYFQPTFYYFNIPLYCLITIIIFFLNGAYDRPLSTKASLIAFGWSTLMVLVVYAMLPLELRTSRMVILLGSLLFLAFLLISRWKLAPWKENITGKNQPRKALIVAGEEELKRIKELINRSHDNIEIAATFPPSSLHDPNSELALKEMVRVHHIREIIFSSQDVPFTDFTGTMSMLGPTVKYMLAASTTMNIVGSINRDTAGESYGIQVDFKLSHASSRRAKRLFDVFMSVFICLLSPVLAIFRKGRYLISNAWPVLTGSKTWVAYHPEDPTVVSLPKLPPGVLYPAADEETLALKRMEHIHYVYARDYHWTHDLVILASQRNL